MEVLWDYNPHVPLRGRGAHYSTGRRIAEWTFHHAYRGHWPARLLRASGLQRPVRTLGHRLSTARWPRGVRTLRIAFASDLHAGPTTHPSLLDDAFARLAAAEADVILLGGDYVFLFADYIDAIADRLRKLAPPLGIFAVMGNHDLWADDALIADALTRAGARVLVNERVRLPSPFGHVALAGLDDPWTGARPQRPLFPGDDAAAVRVVLVHAP